MQYTTTSISFAVSPSCSAKLLLVLAAAAASAAAFISKSFLKIIIFAVILWRGEKGGKKRGQEWSDSLHIAIDSWLKPSGWKCSCCCWWWRTAAAANIKCNGTRFSYNAAAQVMYKLFERNVAQHFGILKMFLTTCVDRRPSVDPLTTSSSSSRWFFTWDYSDWNTVRRQSHMHVRLMHSTTV